MLLIHHLYSILTDDAASQAGDLYIRSICFSNDGKYLATGAEDRQIRVSNRAKKVCGIRG
jgi:glucose repression regulatory protein TUP1